MTVDDVLRGLEEILQLSGDDERAHGAEDALFVAVLESIADGEAEDPVKMARLALTSRAIPFARYCT